MKRAIAGVVVVAAAAFGGAGIFDDNTVRDESGAIVESGGLGALSIQIGDCVNLPDSEYVESLEALPCADAHDAEAFEAFDMRDGDFPGDDAVQEAAINGCYEAFEPFVGVAYEDSELGMYWLYPTPETWDESADREILCRLTAYGGSKPPGPMRGAGI